jgi:hypothetical protein
LSALDPLPWLLEKRNPSARYLALTALLDLPEDDPEVIAARAQIPGWGQAQRILDAQWPQGYWLRPGIGYSPKHKATVWQVIFLSAMGAPCTPAIERACEHLMDHSRLPDGRFSAYKTEQGAVTCLNGNLLRAMLRLGYQDPRLAESLEVLGEVVALGGFRCRFNAPGPPPARMRDGYPCAWGAIKALGAFAEVPEAERSLTIQNAIDNGVDFLLACDGVKGDSSRSLAPSPLWSQFGFPLGFTSDLLELLDVLGRHRRGYLPADPMLAALIEQLQRQRDAAGSWTLEYSPRNTWASFGDRGQPNKWVTLRALRALKLWDA